jgi:hypothetical protein
MPGEFLNCSYVNAGRGKPGTKRVTKDVKRVTRLSSVLFVFRNRAGTALKVLTNDGRGYWLCLRRFSKQPLHSLPTRSGQTSAQAALVPGLNLASQLCLARQTSIQSFRLKAHFFAGCRQSTGKDVD